MVNCSDADFAPSLSAIVTLHTLLPAALGATAKLSIPAGLSCGAALNSAVLLQAIVKLTVWSASPGPAEMLVAQAALYAPELSLTVTVAAPLVKVGASFTAASIEHRIRLRVSTTLSLGLQIVHAVHL
jgi:hypothetical protein